MELYYSVVRGNASNTKYPQRMEVNSSEDLEKVVCYDHVCAKYVGGHRKNDNFISADCSMFDVDNIDSDDPDKWITPDMVCTAFPDVPFYVSYSRNNMKEKNGKAPRPKFHVYFPDKICTVRKSYEDLKDRVCRYFPAFDQNAKDSARLFYGVENPVIKFFDGGVLLSDFMETVRTDEEITSAKTYGKRELGIIPEGSRHCTLISYAARILKRYGDTEQAALLFESECGKCVPRLGEEELTSIWKDSRKFFHEKVESDPGYLPPELYEIVFKGDSLRPNDLTDLGQTMIFVRECKDTIRYSPVTEYLIYMGTVWKESNEKVHRLVQLLTDFQLKEVSALMAEAKKKEKSAIIEDDTSSQEKVRSEIKKVEAYNKFVMNRRHTARISAVLTEARPMVEIIEVKIL